MTLAGVRERPAAGPVRRRRTGRRWPRRLAKAVFAVVVLGALLLGAGWVLTPSVDDASDRVAAHLAEHTAPALRGDVPAKLAAALIATEDSRFLSTPGIDPLGMIREPLGAVTRRDEGGATLEQQLAKNIYEQGGDSLLAKGAAVVLALKLDRSWTKQQILRMYLDDGYYGHGLYGLTEATEGYFGVPPARLTWAQATLLAGLFQAHVLDRLVATGRLTRAQADAVAREPWGLVRSR